MENKIILIEDDEEIRSMVKDYLSGEFQVLPFSEGKTAIHTVKNYDEYSLALIDLMLPDMSGICCSGYIVLVDRFFDMLEGTFQISMLQTWIPMAITTVVVCTVLSLWPFIIGMIRKSVPATIVTSLVVIVFRQLIISKNITYQESLLQILLVAFITFGVALFAFKKKVPKLY